MMKMAKKVLVIRKAEYGSLIVKLLVMIMTLISLLTFVLLGWHSLGMSGGFAAGTGSSILAGIGRLIGKLGEDEEDDGGGGRGKRNPYQRNNNGGKSDEGSIQASMVGGDEDEQTQTAPYRRRVSVWVINTPVVYRLVVVLSPVHTRCLLLRLYREGER